MAEDIELFVFQKMHTILIMLLWWCNRYLDMKLTQKAKLFSAEIS
jgi:hypothetical protein